MNTATLHRIHTVLKSYRRALPFCSSSTHTHTHAYHADLTPPFFFVGRLVILPHGEIEKLSSKAGYEKI